MIISSIRQTISGCTLATVAPDTSVRVTRHTLDRLRIGALSVLGGGKLIGLLSMRDIPAWCQLMHERRNEYLQPQA